MKILITGGAGYVGSALVPELLKLGHIVTVLDTFWFMKKPFKFIDDQSHLRVLVGDIRDYRVLDNAFKDQDAVIHLACVSNDPSFEMNKELGRSINYDSFYGILEALKAHRVPRFIYASSSSVYGVKEGQVTESVSCDPLTDYSKYKLQCELDLQQSNYRGCWTILRPSTVCGFSQRLRLDLSVNVLTINALVNGKIIVHGGNQLRPNLNIRDMVQAYIKVLTASESKVHRETFNVGYENRTIMELAEMVRSTVHEKKIDLEITNAHDNRSYHVNSDKFNEVLSFYPSHSIQSAIGTIKSVYEFGFLEDPLNNPMYYNIKRMKELGLA